MSAAVHEQRAAGAARTGDGEAVLLERVTKGYGGVRAVDDLTLGVAEGEFLTLLGPSGCGKTTTLRLIGGFEQPDTGAVRIDGEDMARRPAYRRPVNTVFQQYALFPHLSVRDNIGYGLKHRGVARADVARRVDAMMELMQIPEAGDRRPRQLSGGQQQRVALARALVMEPRVLLLDEPLGSLDYNLRKAMQFELKRVHREVGVTFVYVTHDQEEAMTMSDRVVVMRGGRVEQDGTPADVYDRPATAFVAAFVGDTNLLSGTVVRASGDGVTVTVDGLGEIAAVAAAPLAAGDRATIGLRPSDVAVQADEQGGAVVHDAVLVGGHVAMSLGAGANGLTANVARGAAVAPGTAVRIVVAAERVRAFPREEAAA